MRLFKRLEFQRDQHWISVVGALLLGAAAMYACDPRRGRSRRAVMRYKTRSLLDRATNVVDVATRDTVARLRGMKAHISHLLSPNAEIPDNRVLMERVRSKLGRVVSNPHAIDVMAWQGRVTLTGPVLAKEEASLMAAVRSIVGVKNVENRLEVYDRPDHVPALQGSNSRSAKVASIRARWSPILARGSIVGGGALILYGLTKRQTPRISLTALGVGLLVRGVMDKPVTRVLRQTRNHGTINLRKTIHVAASPEIAFDMLSKCENFSRFMSHVQEIRDLGDGRSHWVIKGPAGGHIEWDSVMTQAVKPRLIAWHSEPGALMEHTGYIRFERMSDGTRIILKTSYRPSATLGHAFADMLDSELRQRKLDDLMRMKRMIETENSSGIKHRDYPAV